MSTTTITSRKNAPAAYGISRGHRTTGWWSHKQIATMKASSASVQLVQHVKIPVAKSKPEKQSVDQSANAQQQGTGNENQPTAANLIAALGANEGSTLKEHFEIRTLLMHDNINKASNHTTEILAYLVEVGFHPVAAYLRIDSPEDYSVLLILPEDEYLDDKIFSVISFISQFEKDIRENLYTLQFSICDSDDNLDEGLIWSDGFIGRFAMELL